MNLLLLDLEELKLDDGLLFKDSSIGEQTIKELKRLQALEENKILMPYNELISRRDDMSSSGKLTLFRQADGDICVTVTDKFGQYSSIEFCVPGSGGGKSPNTLIALNNLGIAMVKDNKKIFP